MQVYVKKDCVNNAREYMEANTVATIDKSKDAKLIDLGLVEEFDEKKHKVSDTKEVEVVKLKEKVSALEESKEILVEENETLKEKVSALKDFLNVAITLPKGQSPEGYENV